MAIMLQSGSTGRAGELARTTAPGNLFSHTRLPTDGRSGQSTTIHVSLHDVDVAVLDINLDGELVWPVARALKACGTPCIFTTGYAETRPTHLS